MILILLYHTLLFLFHPQTSFVPLDRWLIEMKSADDTCLEEWWNESKFDGTDYLKKALPIGNWFVVTVPKGYSGALANLPCVSRILVDQRIEWRNTVPNDPAFINQYSMNMIGMTKAWDITTGGLTTDGDTIVVAVVDDGFDVLHPDLVPNIWLNREETPNDQLDNDGNGYTDDYVGLNILTGNDSHQNKPHGTEVSGIIGAKGNNIMGITGVNWNIKLLLVSGAEFESEVIEGYQYILEMRKKYNDTGGSEGAFVVATNLSGGINGAFAEDHPMWCEMYDKLGEEGILSVTAAPNDDISVDIEGDMPTTCTSPYMIAVTSVDPTDFLVGNGGYGNISIDLGAPGVDVLTSYPGDQYKIFTGTSAAAPHVTGTIGLMYSTPCTTFLNDIHQDPDGTALRVKEIIFSTAVTNNSLQGITVTGKRLQVDAALSVTETDCGVNEDPGVRISFIAPNPVRLDDVRVYFEVRGDTSTAFFDLYMMNGAKVATFPISHEEFQQGYLSLDTRPLAAGIYPVTLRNKKTKATAKLFVY